MGKILIKNTRIFNGTSPQAQPGNVLIENNRIKAVGKTDMIPEGYENTNKPENIQGQNRTKPADGTSGISMAASKKETAAIPGSSAGAEETSQAEDKENTVIIDGNGRFLMPGLIDAHWHAYLCCNTMLDLMTADQAYTQLKAGREAGQTLLRGFTTIRDAGGAAIGLKRAIDQGIISGPRIYPSGPMISQTGGHGDFRAVYEVPLPFDCCGLTHTEEIGAAIIADGVDAVIAAARNNLRIGASQLKLMTGGGVASLYDNLEDTQFFEDEIRAAVQVAADAGTYVMVHVYIPKGIERAVRAGVKSIEHGHLIDEKAMWMIAENEVWLSMQPFALGDNDFKTPEQQRKNEMVVEGTDRTYTLAKKYGVKLAWGTDLLFDPSHTKNQNRGIAKLTQWFSNLEILRMVTRDNGELMALSGNRNPYPGRLGVIEAGAYADLILTDGDPLQDIGVLTDPGTNFRLIVKDGKIYKNTLE